jgi:tetratricopeptide (TPR) repeat protein
VEINPNYAAAVANIGSMHSMRGELAEAFRWYKRSMALNPTDFHIRYTIAMLYAGRGFTGEMFWRQ